MNTVAVFGIKIDRCSISCKTLTHQVQHYDSILSIRERTVRSV